jgi:hypothetical protein
VRRIQQRTRAMTIGERYSVWYDSADPEVVVVQRGYWIHWMMYPLIVGSGFFLLCGIGKIVRVGGTFAVIAFVG